MKLKINIMFLLTIALVVTILTGTFIYIKASGLSVASDWFSKKQEAKILHDKKVSENEQKSKNISSNLNAQVNSDIKDKDIPAFTQIGIVDAAGIQLPLPNNLYNIINIGYSAHDLIAVGTMKDDPNKGVIIDIYVAPKTWDQKVFTKYIDNSGDIKLINFDNVSLFTYKTSKGDTGIYDIKNHK